MEISLYRDEAVSSASRTLRAQTYNMGHTLLAKNPDGVVFLPIRSMQFLAILDAEEWVFVDGEKKHLIEVAWQKFRPQSRSAIDEAVPFEAMFYTEEGPGLMSRLESAVHEALLQEVNRMQYEKKQGEVLPFRSKESS
ncbi:hypothetical protein [Halothiobacillus sp.]|uniref:hypothetical protein n=1 Tax=Halothiobacillus sp. TaxID=1891311 RepID=UPI0026092CC7|nr:hypothetical protein [Halothiobacillus sp.]